jgi:hypothetical protein
MSKRPGRDDRRLIVCALALAALAAPAQAINLKVSAADVERAMLLGREPDSVRARFHAPYVVPINDPFIQSLEIVTEYRRVVLVVEDHITKGDRAFTYNARAVSDAVSSWKGRVGVLARLRFHPQNAYIHLPKIEVTLDGPDAATALIGVRKESILGFSGPGFSTPIMGAIAEGLFDAAIIGQSQRNVTLRLDGKELAVRRLDFAAVE